MSRVVGITFPWHHEAPEIQTICQFEFAQRLRSLRNENGWTLATAHEKLGVHLSYLSELEREIKCSPSETTIVALCKGYQIPRRQLLCEDFLEELLAFLKDNRAALERYCLWLGVDLVGIFRLSQNNLSGIRLTLEVLRNLQHRAGLQEEQILDEIHLASRRADHNKSELIRAWATKLRHALRLDASSPENYYEHIKVYLKDTHHVRVQDNVIEQYLIWNVLFISKTRQVWFALRLNPVEKSFYATMIAAYLYLETQHQDKGEFVLTLPPSPHRSLNQRSWEDDAFEIAMAVLLPDAEADLLLEKILQAQEPTQLVHTLRDMLAHEMRLSPAELLMRLVRRLQDQKCSSCYFVLMERSEYADKAPNYQLLSHVLPSKPEISSLAHYEHHCRRWLSVQLLEQRFAEDHTTSSFKMLPAIAYEKCEVLIEHDSYIGASIERYQTDSSLQMVAFGISFKQGSRYLCATVSLPKSTHSHSHPLNPKSGLAIPVEVGQTCETCQHFDSCQERERRVFRHIPATADPKVIHQKLLFKQHQKAAKDRRT